MTEEEKEIESEFGTLRFYKGKGWFLIDPDDPYPTWFNEWLKDES